MSNGSSKPALGRQTHLPFNRALKISMNSLKIRFWRSIITASGILLGIAFFTTVYTQSKMQWPVVEKVDAGFVRLGGQVLGPGDFKAWKPIPVDEGLKAGIPQEVIDKALNSDGTMDLATIVQGQKDLKRAKRNLTRVKREWIGLKKVAKPLTFYMDGFADKDLKVSDAIKMGVPADIAKRLAGKGDIFKGSKLQDEVRDEPKLLNPFYSSVLLDQDINIKDAIRAGVPEGVAEYLAGDINTFRAAALNDAILRQPTWIKIWTSRGKRNTIFNKAPVSAINRLAGRYARTLGDVLNEGKGFDKKTAYTANVMIVNKGGRKLVANFAKTPKAASAVNLHGGDTILVPDLNSHYRTIWLVIMALLVSSVGITNSMLMSVTERFREIGTMKCLGALDQFVLTLFMLESGMMGIVASVMGWFIGFITMILIAGFSKGWGVVAGIGILGTLETLVVAVSVGLIITTLATIAPALRAANMPAAMALRTEI